jgi:hypothetical protein
MDKVNQVLALFGYQMMPGAARLMGPYEILLNHFNRNVRVTLKNKTELAGSIIDSISESNEIKGWKLITSNNNATKYKEGELLIVKAYNG